MPILFLFGPAGSGGLDVLTFCIGVARQCEIVFLSESQK
jgi:hypothetical protein